MADGMPRKHARHAHKAVAEADQGLSTAEQLRLAQEQISQLQAQLNMLASKLDQNAAASKADTAAAVSVATNASTKADAVAAKVDAVKVAEVKTEKSVDAMSWASGTKVSGRLYFNGSSISASNAAGANVEKDGGFQIKRAYISIDHQFNKVFAADVTMDADNIVRGKSVTDDTAKSTVQGFYIKKAYLEAKIDPALVVRLGSADMPWIPFVENIYGYRHIEKTLIDLNSYGTSADWGAHVGGQLLNNLITYQVSAVNGGGYRDPQLTQHVDLEGRVALNYMGFTAAVGGYSGKLGNETAPGTVVNNVPSTGITKLTARRFDALVAYKGNVEGLPITIGGEYLDASNYAGVTSGTVDRAVGYSVFASVSPAPKWSVFGRYDRIKPNKDTNAAKVDHYFNVGLQWEPVKVVDLALVYKRDAGDGGVAIGNLASPAATRDEIGIYGQVKF